jgi:hypothetical protein
VGGSNYVDHWHGSLGIFLSISLDKDRKIHRIVIMTNPLYNYIGVFSPAAALEYGTFLYMDADGRKVEVTGIFSSVEDMEENYQWDDKYIVSTNLSDECVGVNKPYHRGMMEKI